MSLLRKATIAAVSCVATLGASLAATPLAHASDWGGIINPVNCSGSTVKYLDMKDWLGRKVGRLEIRWSDACYVQWARLTSSGAAWHLAVTIKENSHPSNAAGADDYNVNQNWTRGIYLVDGPNSHVCAYGDIYSNSPTGAHYSAVVCA